jgi:hypothetical protein
MVGFASLYLPYSPALPRRRQAHLQVIKTADWVIDLGREGGDEIVAWGPFGGYRQGTAELYGEVSGPGVEEGGWQAAEERGGE